MKISGTVIELKIDVPSAIVIKREAPIPVILLHNTHRSAAPCLHVVSAPRTASLLNIRDRARVSKATGSTVANVRAI
jgi:hypothetical protein